MRRGNVEATPRLRVGIILVIVAVVVIAVVGTVFAIQRAGVHQIGDQQESDQQPSGQQSGGQQAPEPGSPQPAESTQGSGLPQAPAPDEEAAEPDMSAEGRATLEAVALEAATMMTSWDPNEDFNQTSAELRATELMTEERADQIVAPERPATGIQWLEAAEAGATSEPSVEVNEGTESDVVSVIATWVWLDADGHVVSNPDERRVFYFDFEQVDGELLISDYQWESL